MDIKIVASTAALTSATALAVVFLLVRIRKKNNELLKLKHKVLTFEADIKAHLLDLVKNQGGASLSESWVAAIFAEIRRLDFNLWKIVQIDEMKVVVLTQMWYLLQWLTLRQNPEIKKFLQKYESTGLDNRQRLILIFNDKSIPVDLRTWLQKSLDREITLNHPESLQMMREYIGLRNKIKSVPKLPF